MSEDFKGRIGQLIRDARTHDAEDWIEPCPHVLARTAGQKLVTDDNMGTEWRQIWEPQ